ncbi:MAG: hypothetical protein AB7O59_00655 [Pirellulales bacterium]
MAALTALEGVGLPQARAEHWVRHALMRVRPVTQQDCSVETLAKEIDYLEHHIDTYGSVVPKQPDVWGQARLTKHRQEVERVLYKELEEFKATLQGVTRRSDQAFLGMALALGAAVGDSGGAPAATASATSASAPAVPTVPEASSLLDTTNVIKRDGGAEVFKLKDSNFAVKDISLEPTIYLDQLNRYLAHLQELRRINEGDDTADSPGYSLNLVRIPVSVIPGKLTRKGYGAQITLTAQPHLGDDLLPLTFRNLVINDVVDQLGLPITKILERPDIVKDLEAVFKELHPDRTPELIDTPEPEPADAPAIAQPEYEGSALAEARDEDRYDTAVAAATREQLPQFWADSFSAQLTPRAPRTLTPYPGSQIPDIFGKGHVLGHVVLDAVRVAQPHVSLLDIEGLLRVELSAAFDFLELPQAAVLWEHCTPELADSIHARQRKYNRPMPGRSVIDLRNDFFRDIKNYFPRAAHTATVSLAWAIIVESALLNKRLMEDMRNLEGTKGCSCLTPSCDWMDFYLPEPSPEARAAFNEYVNCRWPVIVFALDPVTDDQNIADVFSRSREMQLAMAVGVAQGTVRANAAMRFMRRLETDIETIALNRTAVGFSHGSDTFGWRFYPRVQTPDTPGTLRAAWQTVSGGPSRDSDIRQRELEPAIRECNAIVIMPSFVPYVTFDSRANWFSLTHPRKLELTLHEAMKLSRTFQGVQNDTACVSDSHAYRPGDVSRLVRVVEQLDRRMPLQSMMIQVPYENQLGGFEMFSTGVTDLGPELRGFYGEPGVIVDKTFKCAATDAGTKLDSPDQCAGTCQGTTLFLVGDHFSVHDTKVIAGDKCVPFTLLSRQIMRVTIPPNVQTFPDKGKDYVDVHIATPYGVTSHLAIPAVKEEPKKESGGWNWVAPPDITLCFEAGGALQVFVQPPGKLQDLEIKTSLKGIVPAPDTVEFQLDVQNAKGESLKKDKLKDPVPVLPDADKKLRVKLVTITNGQPTSAEGDLFKKIADLARLYQNQVPLKMVIAGTIHFKKDPAFLAPPDAKLDDTLIVKVENPSCKKCCGEALAIGPVPGPAAKGPAAVKPPAGHEAAPEAMPDDLQLPAPSDAAPDATLPFDEVPTDAQPGDAPAAEPIPPQPTTLERPRGTDDPFELRREPTRPARSRAVPHELPPPSEDTSGARLLRRPTRLVAPAPHGQASRSMVRFHVQQAGHFEPALEPSEPRAPRRAAAFEPLTLELAPFVKRADCLTLFLQFGQDRPYWSE